MLLLLIFLYETPTKENTAANAPNAFHDRCIMLDEVVLAHSGSIGAVHVVQVTAYRFVTVFQVHVLQQSISQRTHAEKRHGRVYNVRKTSILWLYYYIDNITIKKTVRRAQGDRFWYTLVLTRVYRCHGSYKKCPRTQTIWTAARRLGPRTRIC